MTIMKVKIYAKLAFCILMVAANAWLFFDKLAGDAAWWRMAINVILFIYFAWNTEDIIKELRKR